MGRGGREERSLGVVGRLEDIGKRSKNRDRLRAARAGAYRDRDERVTVAQRETSVAERRGKFGTLGLFLHASEFRNARVCRSASVLALFQARVAVQLAASRAASSSRGGTPMRMTASPQWLLRHHPLR